MALSLANKVVVVTGASRGIGLAIAERFAAAGARLAICGRHEETLKRAADRIAEASPEQKVLWLRCDVADFAHVRKLHAEVDTLLGVPDILVNNAGAVVRQRL